MLGLLSGAGAIAITGGSSDEYESPAPHTLEEHHTDASQPAPAEHVETESATPTESDADVEFEVTNLEISECGTTCRDATIELTNTGTDTATNVTGTVTVVAGDTHVWEGEEHTVRLEAGDTVTRSERIDLDFRTALAIQNNDRQVTVTTTIESDQQTTRTVDELSI